MHLETVSEYLARGGTVTRCPRGAFARLDDPDGNGEYRSRGGRATRLNSSHRPLPGPGVELGRRVRAARLRLGLTCPQLGLIFGKTDGWVQMLEHGKITLTKSRQPCRELADKVRTWLENVGG
jgi:hypothetical protein